LLDGFDDGLGGGLPDRRAQHIVEVGKAAPLPLCCLVRATQTSAIGGARDVKRAANGDRGRWWLSLLSDGAYCGCWCCFLVLVDVLVFLLLL
jgi:hypothetical protein